MKRGTVSHALLLAVIALLVVAYLFRSIGHHQPSLAAQAMIAGEARGLDVTAPEIDDQALSDDEEAAGAIWARKHPGQRCPTEPVAFRQGCESRDTSR